VRAHVLRALGRIGNPMALQFLLAALRSPEPDLRRAAVEGLAALRYTPVIGRLRRMARPWPFSRQPREVKQACRQAVALLEVAVKPPE
jgi:HEAT repeat protein